MLLMLLLIASSQCYLDIWACHDYTARCWLSFCICLMVVLFLSFCFLYGFVLCGLWLSRGSPLKMVAEPLVACVIVITDLAWRFHLSWKLVHSDKEFMACMGGVKRVEVWGRVSYLELCWPNYAGSPYLSWVWDMSISREGSTRYRVGSITGFLSGAAYVWATGVCMGGMRESANFWPTWSSGKCGL